MDQLRGALAVLAGGVLAHIAGEGGQGQVPDKQRIQHSVVGHGLGHRAEAPAVVPAVADAQDGGGPNIVDGPHADLHGPGKPLAQGTQQGEDVGHAAPHQGQPLVAVDLGGHPGINAGADHVQPQQPVALHQIKGGLGAILEGGQIAEPLPGPLAENTQEVVSCANGHMGDGGVGTARRPVHHLVEGAVPAAGVEPDRLPGLSGPAGKLPGVPGLPGIAELILTAGKDPLDLGLQPLDAFAPAGGGIDDKKMSHWNSSTRCSGRASRAQRAAASARVTVASG